jgi:hypothetical protein
MTIRAFLSLPRTTRQNSTETPNLGRRVVALSLAILLLPCAQLDLFAQQQAYPPPQAQQPGYPQQQQDYPPPPPDYQQQQPQQDYAPQQDPQYAQQYPQQPYSEQQQYPDQAYNQAPQPYAAPQQAQQPLAPDQLDQLIAPIALYPDSLIAQILAASTFPEQIASADRWRQNLAQNQGYAAPQDIAAGANAQPWDPSVKALTAFPQVLSELDRNLSWTTELGNAYYNQPQDVFDAIQAMRQRAQAAGTLQNTPQETVTDDQGTIALAPANPQVVYVPTYDPWTAYGAPINPWPGFFLGAADAFFGVGLRFGPGFVMSAFTGMPWGWGGWGLSWLGHCLFFDHAGYYPHGPALRDWGLRNGGPRWGWNRSFAYARAYDRGFNRGGYDRGGAYGRGGYDNRGGYNNRGGFDGRAGGYTARGSNGFAANRGYSQNRGWDQNRGLTDRNGFASRPGYSNGFANNGTRTPQQAWNRTPAFNSRPGAGSYGNGSYGGYNRPSTNYGSSVRAPQSFQSYRGSESYGRPSAPSTLSRGFGNGFQNSYRQPQSSFRSQAPGYRAYSGNSFSQNSRAYSGGGFSSRPEHFSSNFGGGGSRHFSGGGGSHSFGGGGHSSSGGGHSSAGSHGGGGGGHHH